ncbi:shufflon system plasmid conjugative transfer pilus tip adhesin PilV [Marinobacterium sp. BA1]|uniref:shufflon system plasmid conjugative transfer pilus tip adhesin PilV n=1 Tax=Marinobacterium sp. BA1 TaxID=3138931 RepID=UPI0032E71B43
MSSSLSNVHHKQRGLTLVEVAVSLSIASLVVAGVVTLISRYMEDTRLTLAGQHMKTIGDAYASFIQDNYSTIIERLDDTGSELMRLDVDSDLIANRYLPDGYTNTNSYGQSLCALVRQDTSPSGRVVLEGLLVTEGGRDLDDVSLSLLASQSGAAGGAFYDMPLNIINREDSFGNIVDVDIYGVLGGWNLHASTYQHDNISYDTAGTDNLNCSGGTGPVSISSRHAFRALWLDHQMNTTAFLYRDDVGNPIYNTMNTDLHMGGYLNTTTGELEGGNFIDGLAAVDEGTVCNDPSSSNPVEAQTIGALALNKQGKLLNCREDEWKFVGEVPIENTYAALSVRSCSSDNHGQVYVVKEGDEVGGTSRPRIFICNGSDWHPSSFDELGNLDVYGDVIVHSDIAYSPIAGLPNLSDGRTVIAGANYTTPCSVGSISTTRTGSIMECLAEINPVLAPCPSESEGLPFGTKAIADADYPGLGIEQGEIIMCVEDP